MHSLKILPFSPPPALPRHRCSPYQTVVSCRPRRPGLPFASHPAQPPRPTLSRCHRSPRTLRAVIVVLVLWLVRETFSGLLLG